MLGGGGWGGGGLGGGGFLRICKCDVNGGSSTGAKREECVWIGIIFKKKCIINEIVGGCMRTN